MATIFIDNKPYQVRDGLNLLHACLSLGFNLPYFCWHPALGSVGACRQCAVKQYKDESDSRGRLVMACMTPAIEGTRISIFDPDAKAFRASVIEWLMINHPHDCPVCDEGGECHLQDMTVMTGHAYRRYRFGKRTFRNQYLGPFVRHELNRCIQCYRCVRYYRDYAGGHDLNVFGCNDKLYFGRAEDGVLESEFSGNLVEVCPTGVFTDMTLYHHYIRKWDLQTAPSICVNCAVGCNTIPGERYGSLRRILNRFNGQVNGYFLCDRGRYGYEFVNAENRVRVPLVRAAAGAARMEVRARAPETAHAAPVETGATPGEPAKPETNVTGLTRWVAAGYTAKGAEEAGVPSSPTFQSPMPGMEMVTVHDALERAAGMLASARGIVGIGSPRASLESNFALRTLVGSDRFFTGMSHQENVLVREILDILQRGPVRTPSLAEVRQCDAVLVLGEDVTQVAPVLALALRQSVRVRPMEIAQRLKIAPWDDTAVREAMQDAKGPFFIANVAATRLDDVATETYFAAPDDLARLGFAVAEALGDASRDQGSAGARRSLVQSVRETVGLGKPEAEEPPEHVQALAGRIADALRGAENPLVVAGTSLGSLSTIQAAANIAWALHAAGKQAALVYTVPECNTLGAGLLGGGSVEDACQAVAKGRADTVIVLENDLYRRADKETVDQLFARARHVIAVDHLANDTTVHAAVVLPAATFAEGDGTLVSSEGRAQRFYQVFDPAGEVREGWRWVRDLRAAAGGPAEDVWPNLDAVSAALAQEMPVFRPITEIAPPAGFRIAGLKVARLPHRASGRTAQNANVHVSEGKPPADPDAPLVFSMEGFQDQPPPALIPRFWAPGWNSAQALNKFQEEVAGALRGGDPGKRLIEPGSGPQRGDYGSRPEQFRPRNRSKGAEWLLVPLYHCFGSDELSIYTPGVAELSPAPYVALNPGDAELLRVREGDTLVIPVRGDTLRLQVRLMPAIPEGVAGVPAGLPATRSVPLPAWSKIGAP